MLNTKENIHTLTEISLAKYKIWSIGGDRRGDVIRCVSGILWITQEGDQKDYVIEAGRDFWVTKSGTVVVQALDNSKIKYSLNEMENHVEINPQPIYHAQHSRARRLFR
jgi:hypothetical protein